MTRAAAAGVAAELEAALVDVGARHVELERGDALLRVERAAAMATKSSTVVREDVRDHRDAAPPRGWGACRVQKASTPTLARPMALSMPAGGLADAIGGVAHARLRLSPLVQMPPSVGDVEEVVVLEPVTERARRGEHRVLQGERPDLVTLGSALIGASDCSHATSRASTQGPRCTRRGSRRASVGTGQPRHTP